VISSLAGNINVQPLTGDNLVVNNACSSTFGAATPDLKFGTLNVSGDPTYVNTSGSTWFLASTLNGVYGSLLVSAPSISYFGGGRPARRSGSRRPPE